MKPFTIVEGWWWQHHAVGMFFSGRDWETSLDRGKDKQRNVQRSLMKTCSRVLRPSGLGERSPSNRKHTAKTLEWLWDKSLNVLEWPSQSLDSEPYLTSLEKP